MTDKVTLLTFGSDYESKQNLNANNVLIQTAIDNTVSRDGTSPNAMGADFDMNGHRILNLPTPTNPTDVVRLEDVPSITEMEALEAAAAASAASAAASEVACVAIEVEVEAALATIETLGLYEGFKNFFDLVADPVKIAHIQNGTFGSTYHMGLDAYFTTLNTLGPNTWILPQGTYQLANTINMAPGIKLLGAGRDSTIFFLGGTSGQWGMQMLNANGTNEVEGYKVEAITFYCSGDINGLRWNSATGGFTNDGSSQAYMLRASIKDCAVLCDQATGTGRIAVGMFKCFDSVVEDNNLIGMDTGVDFQGTDLSRISHNRIQACQNSSIVVGSQTSFGSTTYIVHNDILNPGLGGASSATAIITSERDCYIAENYIEGNVSVTDCIQITGTNDGPFFTVIENNRVEWAAATNFVRILNGTFSQNPYKTVITGNKTTGGLGNIVWETGKAPYFNNSTGRNYIRVEDNSCITQNAGNIPLQSSQNYAPVPPGYVAQFTTGRAGVAFTGLASGILCGGGDFLLPADSDTGHYIEFSDYTQFNPPGNNVTGTFTITILYYGGTANQTVNWEILDGGSSVGTGSDSATTANHQYLTTMISAQTFSSKPVIRVWNADTGHGGAIYIREVAVRYGS